MTIRNLGLTAIPDLSAWACMLARLVASSCHSQGTSLSLLAEPTEVSKLGEGGWRHLQP